MANLPESSIWEAGIYQLEATDPVIGGVDGIDNQQAKQLANRTVYLKEQTDSLLATRGGYSGSTTFTGNPATGTLQAGRVNIVTGINIVDIPILTLTLPSATTAGAGAAVLVIGVNAGTTSVNIGPLSSTRGVVNIQRAGSDLIQPQDSTTGQTSVSIVNGESILFISNGSNRWMITQWQRADVAPAGTIAWFGAATPPEGYLACNGAAVSRTTYAALFAAIGTTFGAGNGTTTFNLPDLRGEFIRGFDGGRGIDTDTLVLTATRTNASATITGIQDTSGLTVGMAVSGTGIPVGATIATIVSATSITISANATASGTSSLTFSRTRTFGSAQADMFKRHFHIMKKDNLNAGASGGFFALNDSGADGSENTEPQGGSETRPRNIALLPVIKF